LSDAAIIADFNVRMALETEVLQLDPERALAGVTSLLSGPEKGAYFLAEVESAGRLSVAGQLLITFEWSDWRNGNFWSIQSVLVASEFRGSGLFRALYAHVHALAKERKDVCGLRLYVDAHNEIARETYKKIGMKRTNYEIFELDFVLGPQAANSK